MQSAPFQQASVFTRFARGFAQRAPEPSAKETTRSQFLRSSIGNFVRCLTHEPRFSVLQFGRAASLVESLPI